MKWNLPLKHVSWKHLMVFVVVVSVAVLGACGGGGGKDAAVLLEERCTECHGLDRVTSQSKTASEWATTVANMVEKGANLTEAEQETLVDYLAETYGP
jgi:DnaJ-class molecular chaperone